MRGIVGLEAEIVVALLTKENGRSRFREGPRPRLRRFAERLVASTSLHHDIAAVADADHNRAIARQVHWTRLHRPLDIFAAVNQDAHPDRSEHSQFDREATSNWSRHGRLRHRDGG
jgi:hypothetical protein